MKYSSILSAIIFLFVTISCTETPEETKFSELAIYHMQILPENPNSADIVKLIVLDDCTYNELVGVTRSGNVIDIKKQFNSMMKRPSNQPGRAHARRPAAAHGAGRQLDNPSPATCVFGSFQIYPTAPFSVLPMT